MKADKIFPLLPPLPLPDGVTEAALYKFARSVRVADAPAKEMEAYCREDFRRFVYTYGLVRDLNGRGLELGANPYFTTMLIKKFTDVDLSLANYFGPQFGDELTQAVEYRALGTNEIATEQLMSYHFNIEEQRFPFETERSMLSCFAK